MCWILEISHWYNRLITSWYVSNAYQLNKLNPHFGVGEKCLPARRVCQGNRFFQPRTTHSLHVPHLRTLPEWLILFVYNIYIYYMCDHSMNSMYIVLVFSCIFQLPLLNVFHDTKRSVYQEKSCFPTLIVVLCRSATNSYGSTEDQGSHFLQLFKSNCCSLFKSPLTLTKWAPISGWWSPFFANSYVAHSITIYPSIGLSSIRLSYWVPIRFPLFTYHSQTIHDHIPLNYP